MPLQQTERQAKQTAGTSAAPASDPGADTMRFRAATLDEAIAVAEHSLGTRVRVVAANRIRRGGIGGFFASDLGVEVTVALDEETIEQALERLVAETAADERDQWLGHDRQDTVTLSGRADSPMPSGVRPPSAERDHRDNIVTAPAPAPASAPGRAAGPTMVRVEQIIEELQALTAAPLFGDERVRPTFARMRREADERAAAAAAHEAAAAMPVTRHEEVPVARHEELPVRHDEVPVRQVVAIVPPARPSFPPSPGEIAKAAAAAAAAKSHTFRRELRTPSTVIETPEPVEPAQQVSPPEPAPAPNRPASSSAPSRRQVELAVAAADQLIESLKHDDGVKRLSVRVVLRTGDQREVEAEAEWEA
jgi:hypothetical protein